MSWTPEERHLVILHALGDEWRTLTELHDIGDRRLLSMSSVLGRLVKLREEGLVTYRMDNGRGQWRITGSGRRARERA